MEKVSYCFVLDKAKGLGKSYCMKTIQVLLCSTLLVARIIEFMDMSFSKKNIKGRSDLPFPVGNFVHLSKLQEGYRISQNLKKGKAKWHKNCTIEL